MFSNNKNQSDKEELDEIKELVKSNNHMLVSSARAKKIKFFIKLIIFGSIMYFAYSTYQNAKNKQRKEEEVGKDTFSFSFTFWKIFSSNSRPFALQANALCSLFFFCIFLW